MVNLNVEETKVILYALSNGTINNLKGEFIVTLANVLHKLHDSLVKEQQIGPEQKDQQGPPAC